MCIDTDTHAKKINAGLGEVYVMPVIQDILECFGICLWYFCRDIRCWFYVSYIPCGGFYYFFF